MKAVLCVSLFVVNMGIIVSFLWSRLTRRSRRFKNSTVATDTPKVGESPQV